MTWDEYAVAWSKLHGGFDPRGASGVVRGWVHIAYRIGSWLGARRIGPMAVTTAGLLLCVAVPAAALLGRAGLLIGALLVLLAGFADGLDGAVAVVSGRTTRLGFVYDSLADRLGELAWLTAFWIFDPGAPGWLVVAAGATSWFHEYARARATAAGMSEIGVVTVGERPTRVSVAISGLLIAGLTGYVHSSWVQAVLIVAAAAWLALGLIGLIQLLLTVRRELTGP
jgi:CDP-diacylglycerol--glycerol-3-phosphate 3-phosphatidyltransferase